MNREDEDWIIDTVCNFMIDTKEIHKYKSYNITAYSNPDEYKIPIRFQIGDFPIEHLVLEYNERARLKECEGINDYEEFIRLSCDLQKLHDIGYIDYYINVELTQTINQKLNKKGNKTKNK